MKQRFKKTSAIALLITTLSIVLVGCGTGPDSGSMGASSTAAGLIK